MQNIWIIARRELKHYFISPIAYVGMFAILLIIGVIFYLDLTAAISQQYVPSPQTTIGVLLFILPFLTAAIMMSSIAEEQKTGTLELMLTAPIRDWELIVGKWLGGFLFIMIIVVITWIYPIVLNQMVKPGIDQGLLVSGYLGVTLVSATLVAIGIAVSSLFSNQIPAFLVTFLIFLLLWFINFPSQLLGPTSGEIINYLVLRSHFYDSFFQGIIQINDIIYYISVTILALFLGTVSIETRRWR
jgi:ABC-2 type transport system permease protein